MRADKVRANDLLRDARLALVSPAGSGRALSREELADAVNTWAFENLHEEITCTSLSIGVLERGQTRWPRASVRKALCAVLQKSATELGLYRNRDLAARASDSPEAGTDLMQSVAHPGANEDIAAPDPCSFDPAVPVTASQIERAFKDLGLRMRERRMDAGLSQQRLGEVAHFSRSTVANVEVGRQTITREFWRLADAAVLAEGSLLAEFDRIFALKRQMRLEQEQRKYMSAPPGDVRRSDAVTALGSFSLMVSATPLGGVRVVIETGPVGLPGDDAAWKPSDGNVLSSIRRAVTVFVGCRDDG